MTSSDLTPLVLKIEDWPEADQALWDALFAEGPIFEDEGSCRHWSDGTRRIYAQAYGQWLSFIARIYPTAIDMTPGARVTPERVCAWLAECDARLAGRSILNLITGLFLVVRALAADDDWSWLKSLTKRLGSRLRVTDLPPPVPLSAREIFRWSLAQMQSVDKRSTEELKDAIAFRQALMIGFLISRPVRRRTLLSMTVDRHICDKGDVIMVLFAAADLKNKRVLSFPLPKELVAPMRRYLCLYRPILLKEKTSDGLWVSQYGEAITADGLARELPKITQRYLGQPLRPHAFRHIAATSIAEDDPKHVGIIRDILGHATLAMSEAHYNRATGVSSCNKLQSIVEDLRRQSAKIDRKALPFNER